MRKRTEAELLELLRLRLIEQQVWLSHLVYRDQEEALIVYQTHEALSEPARCMLGLALHYPTQIHDVIAQAPAYESSYKRRTKNRNAVNKKRLLGYVRQQWGLTWREARGVLEELADFMTCLPVAWTYRDPEYVPSWDQATWEEWLDFLTVIP